MEIRILHGDVTQPSSSFSMRWSRDGTNNKYYIKDSTQETKYFENYSEYGVGSVEIGRAHV